MTTPDRYRKKPDAIQWTGINRVEVARFIKSDLAVDDILLLPGDAVFIDTLEGRMRADKGDWIIRGVKGEVYPCKPDIFAAIYEAALSSPAPTDRERAIEECAKKAGWDAKNHRAASRPDIEDKFADGWQQACSFIEERIWSLLTAQPSEEGWIKINAAHPLPDDLKVGDEIEIMFSGRRGPAQEGTGRHKIVATDQYGTPWGNARLYQVKEDGDWWRESIVAYRRASGER